MKKILVGLVSLAFATATYAGGEDAKHMVRMYGFDDAGISSSFDVSFGTTTGNSNVEDADSAENNLALNYAYAINGNWQVGGTYKNKGTAAGDTTTMGLSAYYNMAGDIANTCYVGLHYNMTTDADDNKATEIALEYGHRWHLGHAWGMHLTYAPSLMWSQTTSTLDDDSATNYVDEVESALAWNWIKFDVLF